MSHLTQVKDFATFKQSLQSLIKRRKENNEYKHKFAEYQRRLAKNRLLSFNIDEYGGYLNELTCRINAEKEEYDRCLAIILERVELDQKMLSYPKILLKDERMHHLWQISMVIRHIFRTEFGAKRSEQCGYFIDTAMNRIIHEYFYDIPYLKSGLNVQYDEHIALALAISDDGRYLFVAGDNKKIIIRDLVSGSIKAGLTGHSRSIQCLDYRLGTLISGGRDCNIIVWDAYHLKMIRKLIGHTDPVLSANFNPTGDQIVSASQDRTVLLWSVDSGDPLMHFIGHEARVYSAHFLGEKLISGAYDSTVKVWDPCDATHHRTIKDDIAAPFSDVRVNCDSTFVACIAEEHSVMILSLPGLKKVRTMKEECFQCRFHPFIPFVLAMGMSDTYNVKLYDVKRDQWIHYFKGHTSRINSLCFSPDGTRLFSASKDKSIKEYDLFKSFGGDLSLRKYDTYPLIEYPKDDQTMYGNKEWIMCAVISTNGRRLFTGSFDGSIMEWHLVKLKMIKQWTEICETVRCMDYCNRLLVTGSEYGTIKVWNCMSGKWIHSTKAHKSAVNRVLFNEDGTEVYSCSDDMNICRLGINREIITTLTTYRHRGWVESLVYLPQSKMIISFADNSTKAWDLRDGHSPVLTFDTPHGLINDMCINRNESLLAFITFDTIFIHSWPSFKQRSFFASAPTAAEFHPFYDHILALGYAYGSIKLFDTDLGTFIHEFADESTGLHCRVEQVCFTPNGERLLSVGRGKGVKMWDLPWKLLF